ncbi:MAG: T9SS type A sorting domain-containing protein [Bacteroidetes bacterium]|nr:T9SS type A sorting domain-containing protein [Bacteroidota bacterium]
MIYISNNRQLEYTCELYNLMGENLLLNELSGACTVNLSGLPKGIYF